MDLRLTDNMDLRGKRRDLKQSDMCMFVRKKTLVQSDSECSDESDNDLEDSEDEYLPTKEDDEQLRYDRMMDHETCGKKVDKKGASVKAVSTKRKTSSRANVTVN